MMNTNPFAVNTKPSPFTPGKKLISPEPVELIADTNQIVTAVVPFNTPAAPAIRAAMHNQILTPENTKCFIFRPTNGWTNIALDSTGEAPKLTSEPKYLLKVAWRSFQDCQAVSNVTMRLRDGTPFQFDDIDMLHFEDLSVFAAVPVAMPDTSHVASSSGSMTSHAVIGSPTAKVGTVGTPGPSADKVSTVQHEQFSSLLLKVEAIDTKLAFIVDKLTKPAEAAAAAGDLADDNDKNTEGTPITPQTSKSVGKRRSIPK